MSKTLFLAFDAEYAEKLQFGPWHERDRVLGNALGEAVADLHRGRLPSTDIKRWSCGDAARASDGFEGLVVAIDDETRTVKLRFYGLTREYLVGAGCVQFIDRSPAPRLIRHRLRAAWRALRGTS